MATVKFDKSVKYKDIRYAAHVVFEVDDEDVAGLKQAGATVISTKPVAPSKQEKVESKTDLIREELLTYTVAQLTKYAEEHNIDLQGKTRKADIYNLIVATFN